MDVYKISVDASEVARVSGEGLTPAKKWTGPELMGGECVDDPKLIKLLIGGKTILVFHVSQADNVTCERIEG